jgi:hypothetical protein
MQRAEDSALWVSDAARSAIEARQKEASTEIVWIASDEVELKGVPGLHRLWRAA